MSPPAVMSSPLWAVALAAAFALAPQDSPSQPPAPPAAPPASDVPKLGPGDKLCGECHTTGKVAFEVPKEWLEIEKGCTYCSEVVANAAINHGLDYRPCPKCLAPSLRAAVQKQYDADVKVRAEWLAKQREIDAFINDPKNLKLMHVTTPHFDLAWGVQKVKVGKVVLDQHQSLHLYAQRLESLYQLYLDTFALTHDGDQFGARHTVMVFENAKHSAKAQPKYTGRGGTGVTDVTIVVGSTSCLVCWWNKTKNKEDKDLHEFVAHNVVHLILDPTYKYFWLARKNGWVDEGLSHYFTDKLFQMCRSHCFQEADAAGNWPQPPWRPEIRKLVAAGRIPVFSDVVTKHGENLTADEHMVVFSWVQYLIDNFDHAKFVQLLRGLKDQLPLRDVLQETYGVSMFQFVENWKKYVIENYPPR